MRDTDWQDLDDEALERLLVERWLYRGILLGVLLLAAIVTSFLGIRGLVDRADQITVGALLALALAAGAVAFTMRQGDLKIHRELRRRRSRSS
jgi:hypothetical protein